MAQSELPSLIKVQSANGCSYNPVTYRVTATAHHDDRDQVLLSWPSICACCLEPADGHEWLIFKTSSSQLHGTTVTWSHGWKVPYCTRCSRHYRYFDYIPNFGFGVSALTFVLCFGVLLIGAISGSLTVGLAVDMLTLIAVLVALTALEAKIRYEKARTAIRPSCSSRASAVRYEGEAQRELPEWVRWRSRHKFTFTNPEYARAFARSNEELGDPNHQ